VEKGENYPNLAGHYESARVYHWTHSLKRETRLRHPFVCMRSRARGCVLSMKAVTRTSVVTVHCEDLNS